MKIGLPIDVYRSMVDLTGAVVGDPKGHTHDILGFVVFDLSRRDGPPLALAASAAAVARIELPAMTPEAPGSDDPLIFAVRQAHLAKLAQLADGAQVVWLDTTPGGVTVELARSSFDVFARWTLPQAGQRDLGAFPDEPMERPSGSPTVWAAGDLSASLALVRPVAGQHVQIGGAVMSTGTWSYAVSTTTHPSQTTTDELILPPAAHPIMLAAARSSEGNVELAPGETWHHVTAGRARIYLAKLAGAVDDIAETYFGSIPPAEHTVTAALPELVQALRRAGAFTPQVRVTLQRDRLTIEATDGSSSQHLIVTGPDLTMPPALFHADVALGALGRLRDHEPVLVALPSDGYPFAYVSDADTVVALVPQQEAPA